MTETPNQDDIEIVIDDGLPAVGTPATEAPKTTDVDEGINDLKRQLEAERARVAQAEQAASTARQESLKFKTEAEQSQYAAISRALEAANVAVDTVQGDYERALEAGDYKSAAKLQVQITKAVAQQAALENGKAQMDAYRADPRYQQQQHQPALDSFDTKIAGMSQRTQAWLKAHPDAVTDPVRQNKVASAHYAALADGHAPDTDAYFAFVENHAGYTQKPATPQPQRTASPSAPVSGQARAPAGEQVNGNRVVMTPKMREAAKIAGVTEQEYAREYLRAVKAGDIERLN